MITRREMVIQSAAAVAALAAGNAAADKRKPLMSTRPIPSTDEALPVIGLGTYRVLDVAPNSPEYRELPEVIDALLAAGGSVIDSSPMYGRAEAVTGGERAG